ncbi:MAG: hypothetical protein Q4A11_02375, partial [Brachymonas sp.]|nr:hypothetical protein [Brachymonas sp.]
MRSYSHSHPHAHPQQATDSHSHAHTHSVGTAAAQALDPTLSAARQTAEHTWHAHAVNHRAQGSMTQQYLAHNHQRWLWLLVLLGAMAAIALFA